MTTYIIIKLNFFRYFDELTGHIESTFWELHNVFDSQNPVKADAEHLFNSMISTMTKYNIPINNIIGFGSDGCNVMMGEFNSVASRLREHCPGIKIIILLYFQMFI